MSVVVKSSVITKHLWRPMLAIISPSCLIFALLGRDWGGVCVERSREEGKATRRVNGAAKSGGSFVRPKLCNIVHEKWGKQGEYGIFKTV